MAKKLPKRTLNDDRKYMGVWIDEDTYSSLMNRAYKGGETLSQLIRSLLDKAAQETV